LNVEGWLEAGFAAPEEVGEGASDEEAGEDVGRVHEAGWFGFADYFGYQRF
jgi:hypothetical protein